ncbi:hypothetical protein GGR57DRAFT_515951 [Xylariaceae sp. FL1272]|nr:hypothetical protein GGR57DRAFT_515951 [Xylariaceae sp. FL1272]
MAPPEGYDIDKRMSQSTRDAQFFGFAFPDASQEQLRESHALVSHFRRAGSTLTCEECQLASRRCNCLGQAIDDVTPLPIDHEPISHELRHATAPVQNVSAPAAHSSAPRQFHAQLASEFPHMRHEVYPPPYDPLAFGPPVVRQEGHSAPYDPLAFGPPDPFSFAPLVLAPGPLQSFTDDQHVPGQLGSQPCDFAQRENYTSPYGLPSLTTHWPEYGQLGFDQPVSQFFHSRAFAPSLNERSYIGLDDVDNSLPAQLSVSFGSQHYGSGPMNLGAPFSSRLITGQQTLGTPSDREFSSGNFATASTQHIHASSTPTPHTQDMNPVHQQVAGIKRKRTSQVGVVQRRGELVRTLDPQTARMGYEAAHKDDRLIHVRHNVAKVTVAEVLQAISEVTGLKDIVAHWRERLSGGGRSEYFDVQIASSSARDDAIRQMNGYKFPGSNHGFEANKIYSQVTMSFTIDFRCSTAYTVSCEDDNDDASDADVPTKRKCIDSD